MRQLPCGEPTKFVIDQGEQLVSRLLVTLLDCIKDAREIAHEQRLPLLLPTD
jgi:hypothetical protein